jgi:hypothetical protein
VNLFYSCPWWTAVETIAVSQFVLTWGLGNSFSGPDGQQLLRVPR